MYVCMYQKYGDFNHLIFWSDSYFRVPSDISNIS